MSFSQSRNSIKEFSKKQNYNFLYISVKVVDEHIEVKPHKTYIERTVIPNYEEKTIYVPSYVEKTVRVPTIVEKRVKVPAPPTVIEKADDAPTDVIFATRYG